MPLSCYTFIFDLTLLYFYIWFDLVILLYLHLVILLSILKLPRFTFTCLYFIQLLLQYISTYDISYTILHFIIALLLPSCWAVPCLYLQKKMNKYTILHLRILLLVHSCSAVPCQYLIKKQIIHLYILLLWMLYSKHIQKEIKKERKVTAQGIPAWSPTAVLTLLVAVWLPGSDGTGYFLLDMAVTDE